MSNEEVERAIQFLLDNQAQHDYRLAQLETAVTELAHGQRELHSDMRSVIARLEGILEFVERTMNAVRQIAEANAETRHNLRLLDERVERLEMKKG